MHDMEAGGIDELRHRLRVAPRDLLQLTAGPGRARGIATHCGARQVSTWRCTMAIRSRGAVPEGTATFVVPLRAPAPAFYDAIPAPQGSLVVFGPGAEYDGVTPAGFAWVSVTLPVEEVETLTLRVNGSPVRILGGSRMHLRLAPADVARCAALADQALDFVAHVRSAADVPAYVDEWVGVLAATLCGPEARKGPSAAGLFAHRVFARAEEFLREHLTEPIYIADLCDAIGTNERTLQSVFRRRIGLTPLEYLRTVRLHRAREALRTRRGDASVSIRDIARECGLVHPGRFSLAYRAQFGELPSETLRREAFGG